MVVSARLEQMAKKVFTQHVGVVCGLGPPPLVGIVLVVCAIHFAYFCVNVCRLAVWTLAMQRLCLNSLCLYLLDATL